MTTITFNNVESVILKKGLEAMIFIFDEVIIKEMAEDYLNIVLADEVKSLDEMFLIVKNTLLDSNTGITLPNKIHLYKF